MLSNERLDTIKRVGLYPKLVSEQLVEQARIANELLACANEMEKAMKHHREMTRPVLATEKALAEFAELKAALCLV